jgi:hypothetical protein
MRLRFHDCEVDLETREATRAGKPVHLQPWAASLLEVLMRERPRVVGKNELDEALWPEGHAARGGLGRLVSRCARRLAMQRGIQAFSMPWATPSAQRWSLWPSRRRHSSRRSRLLPGVGQSASAILQGQQVLGRGLDCDVRIDASGVSPPRRVSVMPARQRSAICRARTALSTVAASTVYADLRRRRDPLGTAVMIVRFPGEWTGGDGRGAMIAAIAAAAPKCDRPAARVVR